MADIEITQKEIEDKLFNFLEENVFGVVALSDL